jgi:hypothetical protein
MKTAAYIGTFLPDGHLSVEPDAARQLGLSPNQKVRVVLSPLARAAQDEALKDAKKAEVWRQVDLLRERFSRMRFSLTDSLLEARAEEDASL